MSRRICAILQPSYIPWRGYFHQIQKADVFVFYDDVQYDKHGWRNRNRIKTANGPIWLTIPVIHRGNVVQGTPINAIRVAWDTTWNAKHWASIRQAYARAPHFLQYAPLVEPFYGERPEYLADFTVATTVALAQALGIETEFRRSSQMGVTGARTERLINLCRAVGADHYVSGPSARTYLDEDELRRAGITLEYMTYDYPAYEQLHPPFDPQVSILDLLFMLGPRAGEHIWTTPR
jgi:nucleotide-binding universal stress UspA family protein